MNQQELKHILSSKFDFEKWKDLLGTMFLKIDYLTKPIQIEAALVKSGGQVGMIRLTMAVPWACSSLRWPTT